MSNNLNIKMWLTMSLLILKTHLRKAPRRSRKEKKKAHKK